MKTPEPITQRTTVDINVSAIYLKKDTFVQVEAGDLRVEVVYFENGTVQVCCNCPAIVQSFKEVYGD